MDSNFRRSKSYSRKVPTDPACNHFFWLAGTSRRDAVHIDCINIYSAGAACLLSAAKMVTADDLGSGP